MLKQLPFIISSINAITATTPFNKIFASIGLILIAKTIGIKQFIKQKRNLVHLHYSIKLFCYIRFSQSKF